MANYGIYAGTVINTVDPLMKGRMQVSLPMVAGPTSAWAVPCRDYKSTTVPPVGTPVWIMFEAGNVDHPVWMGCAN
jgi:Type VI secretion system/phage-baseplate injector OB domain